jgi:hypothetical protein
MNARRRTFSSLFAGFLTACGLRPASPTATPPATVLPPPATPTSSATNTPTLLRSAEQQATPLVLHQLTISSALRGPAELRLRDSRGRNAGNYDVELSADETTLEIVPHGALGPQQAELLVGGQLVATAEPLFVLDTETRIETGQPRFDQLFPRVRNFMLQGRLNYSLNDKRVTGYRSPDNPLLWLRDHTYQARGFRYFEKDMHSLIDQFRAAQQPDGSLPDWLANQSLGVLQPGRKEVEADLEFLFVQAVVEAWQVTGDDTWLAQNLDAMRNAVDYSMNNPLRWDAERRLVKRPYTIDMWDFAYGPTTIDPTNGKPAPRHWIDDATIWGIFHGDNTGLAAALNLLALAEERLGNPKETERRRSESDGIIDRLKDISWNGRFFTHFVPLEPFAPVGVDASRQLSISNTYALNRSVIPSSYCRAIIDEYFERGSQRDPKVFSEWYSIDPPFPPGSYGLAGRPGEKPGEYVNGGLMPLVGGELARGAFRYGAERYAFEILHRYFFLIDSTNASYLWYYPEGNPGISGVDTLATDGWGASAMLAALIEGAAGVEDQGVRYSHTRLSPRWAATDDVRSAMVQVRYAASDGYAAYRWQHDQQRIQLRFATSGEQTELRILLPAGIKQVSAVNMNAAPIPYDIREVFSSHYVVIASESGFGDIEITW